MTDGRSSVEAPIANSTALLEAHIPELRRFVHTLLRGDEDRADDLLQDTIERAIAHWDQHRSDGKLRNWLHAIAYNRFFTDHQSRLRRDRWLRTFRSLFEGDRPVANAGQSRALAYRDLLRGFAILPAEQRAVLFLVGVEECTYAQAADILKIPIGTVMSRLSRGRERLRQYVNNLDPSDRDPDWY